MKTTWIVVALLVLGMLLLVRERFTTYEEALRDVGQSSETVPSTVPYTDLKRPTMGMEKVRQDISVYTSLPRSDTEAANVYVTQLQTFYDTIYLPDKEEPSQSDFSGFAESVDIETIPERLRPNFRPSLISILDSYFSPTSPPTGVEATEGAEPVPGSAGSGAESGTTTGGTSGVTFGSTSAPKGGRNVWGPLFKGLGEGPGPIGGDSTKTNAYPALLGGMQGRAATRLEGVGIVPPSGFGLDIGGGGLPSLGTIGLPSSGTLGTDANSGFLPYSRQPGDQELIPDPYRLASNFSTSSYSVSKTDPVPFLTDFSAFYK